MKAVAPTAVEDVESVEAVPAESIALPRINFFFGESPPQNSTNEDSTVKSNDIIAPEESSNLLARFLMLWAKPLFSTGFMQHQAQKPLTYAMLLQPPQAEDVNFAYARFAQAWEREEEGAAAENREPRLMRVLFLTFKHYLLIGAALRLLSLVNLLSPFVLKYIVDWLKELSQTNATVPLWQGFALSILLFAVLMLSSILQNESTRFTGKAFSQMRAAVAGAMFNKAVHLRCDHGLTGFITQMHSTDSSRIQEPYLMFQMTWAHPLTLLLALVAVYFFIGIGGACLAGLCLVVLLFQAFCTKKAAGQRVLFSKHADKRSSLLREIISGIRVIKYCVMETSLLEKMRLIREAEIAHILKSFYWRSALDITGAYFPVITTFFLFAVASQLGNTVTTSTMFPTMAMVMVCRLPVYQLAMAVRYMTDFRISLNRVLRLLTYDNNGPRSAFHDDDGEAAILMENVAIECLKPEGVQTLMSNISLEVPDGGLTIICGPTGSGKSLLLLAMMNETMLKSGSTVSLKRGGSFAYVSQVPFLRAVSLKENITMSFGSRVVDEARYKMAVESAQLHADFDALAEGDRTLVVAGGSNLSGGQKQRVSIARAAYSTNSIAVLDDPLSALDPGVGMKVFQHCINGEIMSGRTRVLVTHNTQLLPSAVKVVIVENLDIIFCGSFDEMKSSTHPTVARYYQTTQQQTATSTTEGANPLRRQKSLKKILSSVKFRVAVAFIGSRNERKASELDTFRVTRGSTAEEVAAARRAIDQTFVLSDHHDAPSVIDEHDVAPSQLQAGFNNKSVSSHWGMVWYYDMSNWLNFALVIVLSCAVRGAMIASDLILTYWAGRKMLFSTDASSSSMSDSAYIQWYGLAVALVLALMLAREGIAIGGSTNVVRRSQSLMMKSIIHAPVSFFEANPMGSITSRFSNDLEVCDLKMSQVMNPLVTALATVLGSFALMCYGVPYMSVFVVAFTACYVMLLWTYQCTNGLLKRLEAKNREPMVSLMSEALDGLAVLRAYQCEDALATEHMACYEQSARSVYNARVSREWVTIRLEIMNNFSVLFLAVTSCAVMAVYDTAKRASNLTSISLGITYAISLGQYMVVLSNRIVDSQSQLRNVERVAEYAAQVDPEPRFHHSLITPPADWPRLGSIEFRDVSARYKAGLPLALHGISFTVEAGQHVGLVGRSGSGKSTVTQALFRIIEPCGGAIFIDGLDLSAVDLSDLRSRVAMIAQDPILFSGTLRSNLDPFNEHSDAAIVRVLQRVKVSEGIQPDAIVSDGGANFSVGQRQMICLARAMLRECRIVVLDEATANIDKHTAAVMQGIIDSDFKSCTTITIAHRLESVVTGDRILVLDRGVVIEDGNPRDLQHSENSVFSKMLSDSSHPL